VTDNVLLALHRLLVINWQSEAIYTANIDRSSVALAKEFLRRIALWSTKLGLSVNTATALSVDIAALLIPDIRAPEDYIEQAKQAISLSSYRQMVCLNYLHWSAIATKSEITGYNLPSPYEPAIRLLERGGELFNHNGFIHVSHLICFYPGSLRDYLTTKPLLVLDDVALNALDQQ
jgi:hypothetical protein